MPPNSSRNPKVGPRMKQWKKKRVGVSSLTHNMGRKACWSSKMGLEQIHRREFKIRSTCTTKKRKQLMQIKWKWCGGLGTNNFKHKLYIAFNLWEEAPFPSL